MKYNVSFIRGGVYQANLIEATDEATARAYFSEHENGAEIIGIHPATSDDERPGKPCIEVPADYIPATTEEEPATVRTLDLLDDLDTGDHGDRLNDYRGGSAYICDAITEIAGADVSIYYSDMLDFISNNPEALADVIGEGIYDPSRNYNLWDHARAAEFMVIERDIYDHLADSLMTAAVHFIRYDLGAVEIPAELADLLREWCDDADNNDRMNEIPDRIREYFDEIESAAFDEFCSARDCDTCPFRKCSTLDECREAFKRGSAKNG